MPQQKLSKSKVEEIPPAAKDVFVWDAALPGFGVRVKPTGVRSYVVQYRNRITGVSKRMTLGQHGPCSPSSKPNGRLARCSLMPPGAKIRSRSDGDPATPR